MHRTMLGGKIHRATVTEARLDYEGSVTIDADLLEAADILPNEAVCIWNVTTGSRIQTYALRGEPGSGAICVNGGAAHHASPGHLVIIASFIELDAEEASAWEPSVVFVDENNRISDKRAEQPFRSAG